MSNKQKDNSTLLYKEALRRSALKFIDNPIVMETNGGYGTIYARCYSDVETGVVFEKDPRKTDVLAMQRPHWSVYECDCIGALHSGIGGHLACNFIDIDPYGQPWEIVDAFFCSDRMFPDTIALVVNDGLRQMIKMTGGWNVESVQHMFQRYGNLYNEYLAVCKEMMIEKASQRGYSLTRWHGYYCGYLNQMTHYAAILNKN